MFSTFGKKRKLEQRVRIKRRSNVIQYDDMGYPLRLCIMTNDHQMWVHTYEQDGDIVLKWLE